MNKMNAEGANKVSNTLLSEANETINPNKLNVFLAHLALDQWKGERAVKVQISLINNVLYM